MANNPNAIANLTPIKKGEVRNPTGIKGKQSIHLPTLTKNLLANENIDGILAKFSPKFLKDFSNSGAKNLGQWILLKCIEEFSNTGKIEYARFLFEYAHGKPQQALDITSKNETTFVVNIGSYGAQSGLVDTNQVIDVIDESPVNGGTIVSHITDEQGQSIVVESEDPNEWPVMCETGISQDKG